MSIVLLRELTDGKGFSALPAALNNQRFVAEGFFPILQDSINFTIQHFYPSLFHKYNRKRKLFQGRFLL